MDATRPAVCTVYVESPRGVHFRMATAQSRTLPGTMRTNEHAYEPGLPSRHDAFAIVPPTMAAAVAFVPPTRSRATSSADGATSPTRVGRAFTSPAW